MYVGNMVLGEGHRGPSSRALHRSLGHRPIEKKSILFHQEGNAQPSFFIMAKVKILKLLNVKKGLLCLFTKRKSVIHSLKMYEAFMLCKQTEKNFFNIYCFYQKLQFLI